jgi:hypothetical protein
VISAVPAIKVRAKDAGIQGLPPLVPGMLTTGGTEDGVAPAAVTVFVTVQVRFCPAEIIPEQLPENVVVMPVEAGSTTWNAPGASATTVPAELPRKVGVETLVPAKPIQKSLGTSVVPKLFTTFLTTVTLAVLSGGKTGRVMGRVEVTPALMVLVTTQLKDWPAAMAPAQFPENVVETPAISGSITWKAPGLKVTTVPTELPLKVEVEGFTPATPRKKSLEVNALTPLLFTTFVTVSVPVVVCALTIEMPKTAPMMSATITALLIFVIF